MRRRAGERQQTDVITFPAPATPLFQKRGRGELVLYTGTAAQVLLELEILVGGFYEEEKGEGEEKRNAPHSDCGPVFLLFSPFIISLARSQYLFRFLPIVPAIYYFLRPRELYLEEEEGKSDSPCLRPSKKGETGKDEPFK